jgi:hypothetical protein
MQDSVRFIIKFFIMIGMNSMKRKRQTMENELPDAKSRLDLCNFFVISTNKESVILNSLNKLFDLYENGLVANKLLL